MSAVYQNLITRGIRRYTAQTRRPFNRFPCQSATVCINERSFDAINSRGYHSSSPLRLKDYYDVLGLKRSATKDEIKAKYRELAKKYHPDLNKTDKNAAVKFREITEAYEVLENDEKRQQYDTFGFTADGANGGGPGGPGGNPFGGGNPFAGFGGFGGFGGFQNGGFRYTTNMGGGGMSGEDIFEMLNRAMEQEQARAGRDVKATLSLSFLEAVNGCNKDVTFAYDVREGKTTVRKRKSVNVDIPPGVESGMTIKLTGQGVDAQVGNNRGDLYVTLNVAADPYFKRDKYDIYTDAHISVTQAALGGSIDVCTLDGMVTMKINPGTQPDTNMSLRGKGVKHINASSRRGNHYVKIHVQIPTNLTARQKELLEELAKEEQHHAAEDKKSSWTGTMHKAWDRLRSFMGNSGSASDKEDGEAGQQKASAK